MLGLKAVLYVGVVRERELRRRLKGAEAIIGLVKGEEEDRWRKAEGPATTATKEVNLNQTVLSPRTNEESTPKLKIGVVPEPEERVAAEAEMGMGIEMEPEVGEEVVEEAGTVVERQRRMQNQPQRMVSIVPSPYNMNPDWALICSSSKQSHCRDHSLSTLQSCLSMS